MTAIFRALLFALVLPAVAHGASPIEEAQLAELDRVRGQVANQVQLAAYDLVDELIYQWTTEPVFESATPVVLAGVTVPVGLGSGMGGLVENHIANVLIQNPASNLQLVHCPACTAVVVHSGPTGTIISRGYDNPEALAELGGTTGQHALFIDIEAEGRFLVLRARITRLTPDLPIVWSHTLSTSAATPSLLRQPGALKSASDARAEYIATLKSRGPITIPLRFAVRSYASPNGDSLTGVAPPPFAWVQTGVELGATNALAWTSSLLIGYSFIPQAYQGLMGQARVNRLISGRARSLTRPDLYVFLGGAVITVWGPATAPFLPDPVDADTILAAIDLEGPRTSFGTFQIGADLRLGNRIGFSGFLESIPSLANSQNLGEYTRLIGVEYQSFGTEVTVWF